MESMRSSIDARSRGLRKSGRVRRALRCSGTGMTRADVLVSVAVSCVIAAASLAAVTTFRHRARLTVCRSNLRTIDRAILLFAADHEDRLPDRDPTLPGDIWWWYKERV